MIRERFPNKRPFLQYQEHLQVAWEEYMSGEAAAPDREVVPFRIAESWKRSKGYGLDPFHYQAYVKMKKLNIHSREKLLLTDELVDHWFGGISKKYAFDISIFDAQGNDVALSSAKQHSPSFSNEMVLGTNAAALAMMENRPGCVLAQEHYSRYFHQRLCTAAPFYTPARDVAGAICISTLDFDVVSKMAEIIETLAQLCTFVFALAHQIPSDGDDEFRTILANLPAPILYIDDRENIQYFSHHAQSLLMKYKGSLNLGPLPKQVGHMTLKLDGGNINAYVNTIEMQNSSGRTVILEEESRKKQDKPVVREHLRTDYSAEFSDIVGKAPSLLSCIRIAKQAARSAFPVILNGESGAGKEVFAQAIHNASSRKEQPFIALNCGAIAPELVESELFGYDEGSFTDANRRGKVGLLEEASGGTLFLDEVESMLPSIQAKLLRVFSSGKMARVGNPMEFPVDLRLISAAKVDLRKAAEAGTFREDLFYRISAVSLDIPPLRDRKSDIPLLAQHFLSRWDRRSVAMTPEVMQILLHYSWPGNVRELQNVLIYACIFCEKDMITADCLPEELVWSGRINSLKTFLYEHGLLNENGTASLSKIETELIRTALLQNDCVLKSTANALKIDRKTLFSKVRREPHLAELFSTASENG